MGLEPPLRPWWRRELRCGLGALGWAAARPARPGESPARPQSCAPRLGGRAWGRRGAPRPRRRLPAARSRPRRPSAAPGPRRCLQPRAPARTRPASGPLQRLRAGARGRPGGAGPAGSAVRATSPGALLGLGAGAGRSGRWPNGGHGLGGRPGPKSRAPKGRAACEARVRAPRPDETWGGPGRPGPSRGQQPRRTRGPCGRAVRGTRGRPPGPAAGPRPVRAFAPGLAALASPSGAPCPAPGAGQPRPAASAALPRGPSPERPAGGVRSGAVSPASPPYLIPMLLF